MCISVGEIKVDTGDIKIGNIKDLKVETWNPYDEEYLERLRTEYKLDELVKDCKTDLETAVTVTDWVTSLWEHDGYNQPEQSDPLYILDQVTKNGERFRCVEYGIVTRGCLLALGYDARQLCLKTKDAPESSGGAGHVGCEVFLPEYDKWVWIDGQWGVIPVIDGTPLNAYELGEAIRNNSPGLDLIKVGKDPVSDNRSYFNWIDEYLYYLDTAYKAADCEVVTTMYVPEDGECITVFQKDYPLDITMYLKDIEAFYVKPEK